MRDKYCRKLARRLRGSVISSSLWVDQMETDMRLDTVQQRFINSEPPAHISHVSAALFSKFFHLTFSRGCSKSRPKTFRSYFCNECSFVLFPLSRRLQEAEQQLRTSSLPAIPNPFPELCSPASSPVLSPGSLPPGEPSTGNYVSQPPWKNTLQRLSRYVRFSGIQSKNTI